MNGKIIELLKTKKKDGNGGSEYENRSDEI